MFMYVMIPFLSAPNMSCDILQQDTNTFCINVCLELFHTDSDLTRNVLRDSVCDDAIKMIYMEETHIINILSEIRCSKKIIMYICHHCNTK